MRKRIYIERVHPASAGTICQLFELNSAGSCGQVPAVKSGISYLHALCVPWAAEQ
jgi:hypothetical protein